MAFNVSPMALSMVCGAVTLRGAHVWLQATDPAMKKPHYDALFQGSGKDKTDLVGSAVFLRAAWYTDPRE